MQICRIADAPPGKGREMETEKERGKEPRRKERRRQRKRWRVPYSVIFLTKYIIQAPNLICVCRYQTINNFFLLHV
jgi:hypothetical protein